MPKPWCFKFTLLQAARLPGQRRAATAAAWSWTAATWNFCRGTTILQGVKSSVISSSPDVLGGTPVFVGTRVPVEALLDYLEGGDSIEEFLEGFPSVSREQVVAFLEETKARILAEAK